MQPSCFVVRPRPSFGATRARLLAEKLGGLAPKDVVAPRSDGVPRTAKYQARSREGGHDRRARAHQRGLGAGFSPEAMRFLGELAQARNDGIDIERASTTWSTSSFTSYHGQLLSLAVQIFFTRSHTVKVITVHSCSVNRLQPTPYH
jgi:hypothetical protein